MSTFCEFLEERNARLAAGLRPEPAEVVAAAVWGNQSVDVPVMWVGVRILSSGFDTVVLALSVDWKNGNPFDKLREVKALAKADREAKPLAWLTGEDSGNCIFNVQPYGFDGFEWVLVGREYTFKIVDSLTRTSRPSVMVEIRSETLWRQGADAAVQRVYHLIEGVGGVVLDKVSRLDLCVDVLLDTDKWGLGILEHAVCRARKRDPHLDVRTLEGITFGRGDVVARMYDKGKEIKDSSHKFWFYDVWHVNPGELPEGWQVVRVEFQLRREALKELKIDAWGDVLDKGPLVWAYCCREWLRLVDHADRHHTQQTVLAWWKVVQDGFDGDQVETPATRSRSIRAEKDQIVRQIVGLVSAFAAVDSQDDDWYRRGSGFWARAAMEYAWSAGWGTALGFADKVHEKRAKYFMDIGPRPPAQEILAIHGEEEEVCWVAHEVTPWRALGVVE